MHMFKRFFIDSVIFFAIWHIEKETKTERCGRCSAENSYVEYDELLLNNTKGVPISELEKSIYTAYDQTVLSENTSNECPINGPNLLSSLVEHMIVRSVNDMLEVSIPFIEVHDKILLLTKISIEKRMKDLISEINKRETELLSLLEENSRKELQIIRTELETGAMQNRGYLETSLNRLEYLGTAYAKDESAVKQYMSHCNYIKNMTLELKNLLKDASELEQEIQLATTKHLNVLPFIAGGVTFNGHQHYATLDDATRLLQRFIYATLFINNKTHVFVNTLKLENIYRNIKGTVQTLDATVRSCNFKLHKLLCASMKGPLRGILALFLYIFMTEETKNVYFEDELSNIKHCSQNKHLLHCLSQLNKKERRILNNSKTYFINKMSSLFKINANDPIWKTLSKAVAHSTHFDQILTALNEFATVIFVRQKLLKYLSLLLFLKKQVDKIVNSNKNLLGNNDYSFFAVSVPKETFSCFHYSFLTEAKTCFEQLRMVQHREKMICWRRDAIKRGNTVQKVLEWIHLFDDITRKIWEVKITKSEASISASSRLSSNNSANMIKETKITETADEIDLENPDDIKLFTETSETCDGVNNLGVSANLKHIQPQALCLLFYIIQIFS